MVERQDNPRKRCSAGRRGFTLIELLVVIAVIALLTALAIPAVSAVRRSSQVSATVSLFERLRLALEHYSSDFGDYPPSSPRRLGLRGNNQNDGVECMLRCLMTRARSGPYVDLGPEALSNVDADRLPPLQDPTQSVQTTPDLLEVVDVWGNPIAYLHNADYDAGAAVVLREGAAAVVRPGRNQATGQFRGLTTFQLWSAGPDAQAGTDDDVWLAGE